MSYWATESRQQRADGREQTFSRLCYLCDVNLGRKGFTVVFILDGKYCWSQKDRREEEEGGEGHGLVLTHPVR